MKIYTHTITFFQVPRRDSERGSKRKISDCFPSRFQKQISGKIQFLDFFYIFYFICINGILATMRDLNDFEFFFCILFLFARLLSILQTSASVWHLFMVNCYFQLHRWDQNSLKSIFSYSHRIVKNLIFRIILVAKF